MGFSVGQYFLFHDWCNKGHGFFRMLIESQPKVFFLNVTLFSCFIGKTGARCSSVVRVFAHGAMGCRIDPSWGELIELFLVPASAPQLV